MANPWHIELPLPEAIQRAALQLAQYIYMERITKSMDQYLTVEEAARRIGGTRKDVVQRLHRQPGHQATAAEYAALLLAGRVGVPRLRLLPAEQVAQWAPVGTPSPQIVVSPAQCRALLTAHGETNDRALSLRLGKERSAVGHWKQRGLSRASLERLAAVWGTTADKLIEEAQQL